MAMLLRKGVWTDIRELAGIPPGQPFVVGHTKKEQIRASTANTPDQATSVQLKRGEISISGDTAKLWLKPRGDVFVEVSAEAVSETPGRQSLSELSGQPFISTRYRGLPRSDDYIGLARVLDLGTPESIWFSNGFRWAPVGGRLLIQNEPYVNVGFTGASAAGTNDNGAGKTDEGNTRLRFTAPFEYPAGLTGFNDTLIFTGQFSITNPANTKDIGLAVGYPWRPTSVIANIPTTGNTSLRVVVTVQNRSKTSQQHITIEVFGNGTYTMSTLATARDLRQDMWFWWYCSLRGQSSDEIQLVSSRIELIKGVL